MNYGVMLPNPFERVEPVVLTPEAEALVKRLVDSIAAPTPKKKHKPRK